MARKTKDDPASDTSADLLTTQPESETEAPAGKRTRTATLASARTRPKLWISENRLAAAFDVADHAMETAEEQGEEMTAAQYEALVAQYVNRDDALEERDFFVETVEDVEDLAALKMAQAQRLQEQARHLMGVSGRMRAVGIRVLETRGASELRGVHRILALKRTPGSVEVLDEASIPAEFMAVREDLDVVAIRRVAAVALRYLRDDIEGTRAMIESIGTSAEDTETRAALEAHMSDREVEVVEVCALVNEAEDRLRRVDKKAIQAAWRANDTMPKGQEHLRPFALADLTEAERDELVAQHLVDVRREVEVDPGEEASEWKPTEPGEVDRQATEVAMQAVNRAREQVAKERPPVLLVPGATKVITTTLVFK